MTFTVTDILLTVLTIVCLWNIVVIGKQERQIVALNVAVWALIKFCGLDEIVIDPDDK